MVKYFNPLKYLKAGYSAFQCMCFLLNPEKKIGTDPSCHFREKREMHTL